MILNWIIFGLIVLAIALFILGYYGGTHAQVDDYSFIFPWVLALVCLVIAAILGVGRWLIAPFIS